MTEQKINGHVAQEPEKKPEDNRKAITEKDGALIQEWYTRENVESVDAFIEELMTGYQHDYGTICHVLAASAVQAAKKANRHENGGITGFQAGCVMWEFIRNWMHIGGPIRMLELENMLYPQYESDFDKRIDARIWAHLRKRAGEILQSTPDLSEKVRTHMQSIVNGVVPFGYTVDPEEKETH